MTEWPLDLESYRDDDLYYASTATGNDVWIEVEVPPEDDEKPPPTRR